jgi:hypothetical protein
VKGLVNVPGHSWGLVLPVVLMLGYFFPLEVIVIEILMKEKEILEESSFGCLDLLLHLLAEDAQQFEIEHLKDRVVQVVDLMHSPVRNWNLLDDLIEPLEVGISLGGEEVQEELQCIYSVALVAIGEAVLQYPHAVLKTQENHPDFVIADLRPFGFHKFLDFPEALLAADIFVQEDKFELEGALLIMTP